MACGFNLPLVREMLYVAFIHGDGGPGFGISFPDFPGCVSDGDTIDETVQRGASALAFHIEGMIEDGEAIPAPRSLQDIESNPGIVEWQEGAAICFVPVTGTWGKRPATPRFRGSR